MRMLIKEIRENAIRKDIKLEKKITVFYGCKLP